jgi:hypothetical protein
MGRKKNTDDPVRPVVTHHDSVESVGTGKLDPTERSAGKDDNDPDPQR